MRWIKTVFGSFVLLLVLCAGGRAQGQATASVSGTVRLVSGSAAAGAWVRVQTTSNFTYAGADGSFALGGLTPGGLITITAWSEGIRSAGRP